MHIPEEARKVIEEARLHNKQEFEYRMTKLRGILKSIQDDIYALEEVGKSPNAEDYGLMAQHLSFGEEYLQKARNRMTVVKIRES